MISIMSVCMAFGAVVGTSEGIQASQRRARREEHRSRKNNLVVHCPKSSAYAPQLHGRRVVLSANNCFIDTGEGDDTTPFGHPFAGYYLPYPDAGHAGLVSTITDVAPVMNWVFVDRATQALCYGARAASQGQLTGPWDCTRQDRRLTLCGWEGFVAVRFPRDIPGIGGLWVLFFDCDGDRLHARLASMPPGTVSVEVQLQRRELKAERPMTLADLEKEELARLEREKQEHERQRGAEAAEQAAEQQRNLDEREKQGSGDSTDTPSGTGASPPQSTKSASSQADSQSHSRSSSTDGSSVCS